MTEDIENNPMATRRVDFSNKNFIQNIFVQNWLHEYILHMKNNHITVGSKMWLLIY